MRAGILTFHRAHNYGAVLQCYALQKHLQSNGVDVAVIDYEPQDFRNFYNWFKPEFLKVRNPFEFIRRIKILNQRRNRYNSFKRFIENDLILSPVGEIYPDPFDVIIVGSDQVWNYTNGFDPFYWGAIKLPEKTEWVSYAASMQDNIDEKAVPTIKSLLQNFRSISVRESSLAHNLKEITGCQDICQVVDPTLLLSGDEWGELAGERIIGRPYLLLYMVEYSAGAERIAREIAAKKNIEVVCISPDVNFKTSKGVEVVSPKDFLSLFKHADFAVSASFHGTVFSLQFKRPFLSYKVGRGKDARVRSLLEPIGLLRNFTDKIEDDYNYNCDYDDNALSDMKGESFEYLEKICKPQYKESGD